MTNRAQFFCGFLKIFEPVLMPNLQQGSRYVRHQSTFELGERGIVATSATVAAIGDKGNCSQTIFLKILRHFLSFFFNFWQLLILVDFTRLSNRRKSKQWRGVGGLRGQLSVSLFAHHAKGKWGAHSAVYGARRRATKNDMKNYKKMKNRERD